MFGIGGTELVLILVFAFLIFGPDKLPGMGRTLGRALRQFRNAQEGFSQVVQSEIVDPATEAMSDNPKRPNRNRAAEYEEDADIDLPEGEEAPRPKRAETFAERKKRLAAEKAAREQAEKDAEAATAADDADADEAAGDGAAAEPEPARKPTAADLYAMTPKSHATTTTTVASAAGSDEAQASSPASSDSHAGSDGASPVATHEVSEAPCAERGADGAVPGDSAPANETAEKEA